MKGEKDILLFRWVVPYHCGHCSLYLGIPTFRLFWLQNKSTMGGKNVCE